jgi:hypothetical protein
MSTLTVIRDGDMLLVQANGLYASLGRKQPAGGTSGDDFRRWLADRITGLDMEEGHDYFIYLNAGSVREMLRYESAPAEVKRFFDDYENLQDNAVFQ